VQLLKPCTYKGTAAFKLSSKKYDLISRNFTSVDMAEDTSMVSVLKGKTRNKTSLILALDIPAYLAQRAAALEAAAAAEPLAAAAEPKQVAEDDGVDESGSAPLKKLDPTSIDSVLSHLPSFRLVKSLLQELTEKRGHLMLKSPKFHAECAGVGIEYCFGRAKWYFKKYNAHSTKSLKELSRQSFGRGVLTLSHARKFARKARDYMTICACTVLASLDSPRRPLCACARRTAARMTRTTRLSAPISEALVKLKSS